jgi:hypothetical protein
MIYPQKRSACVDCLVGKRLRLAGELHAVGLQGLFDEDQLGFSGHLALHLSLDI